MFVDIKKVDKYLSEILRGHESTLYDNVKDNHRDFLAFIEEVRAYIKRKQISEQKF